MKKTLICACLVLFATIRPAHADDCTDKLYAMLAQGVSPAKASSQAREAIALIDRFHANDPTCVPGKELLEKVGPAFASLVDNAGLSAADRSDVALAGAKAWGNDAQRYYSGASAKEPGKKAIALLRKALALNPNNGPAWTSYAAALDKIDHHPLRPIAIWIMFNGGRQLFNSELARARIEAERYSAKNAGVSAGTATRSVGGSSNGMTAVQ